MNLRELAADPARFEHHLVVVARAGDAQLELAMASEPLYFAHRNRSDEWALPLRTGDPLLDAFPARTFLSDEDGRDVGRYKHGAGDLVLHPFGLAHWPGRLRPPYEPFEFAPGMRRRGLSVVLCGVRDLPAAAAPLRITNGRQADVKADAGVRMSLVDVYRDEAGPLARLGDATLELLVDPTVAHDDGYLLVLEGDFETDLRRVDRGDPIADVRRALFLRADSGAADPPDSWRRAPDPPFAPLEDAAGATDPTVRIAGRDVPRYWLARTLFRVALHDFQLGWMQTYGDLVLDDRGPTLRIGDTTIPRSDVERLYREVAPRGYSERT